MPRTGKKFATERKNSTLKEVINRSTSSTPWHSVLFNTCIVSTQHQKLGLVRNEYKLMIMKMVNFNKQKQKKE